MATVTGTSRAGKTFLVNDKIKHSSYIIFPHSIQLWDDKFGEWERIKSLIEKQCQGSQAEANKIARYLTLFKQLASQKKFQRKDHHVGKHTRKNATTQQAKEDIELANFLEKSLFKEFSDDKRTQIFNQYFEKVPVWKMDKSHLAEQGKIFEDFLENVARSALAAVGQNHTSGHIGTGADLALSHPIYMEVNLTGVQSAFDASGKVSKEIKNAALDAIYKDLPEQFKKMTREQLLGIMLDYKIMALQGETCRVGIQVETQKAQKIDTLGDFILTTESNGFYEDFLKLIQGKTFSAKNYSFGPKDDGEGKGNSRRLHFGDSGWYRSYSSFIFAGSNDPAMASNRRDMGTFIFSTNQAVTDKHVPPQSDYKILTNYQKWVQTLYEVMGIGQRSDMRLVDYIVVNNANSPRDVITVYSMKEILQNLPQNWYQEPPIFELSKNGLVTLRRMIGGAQFKFVTN